MKINKKSNIIISIYLAWFSAALFFAFQYMLRITPNIMSNELKEVFNINAKEFASLGSLYYLAYSLLQIPIGKITDILGVKKIILSSIILCIIGGFIFTLGYKFYYLQIGRVIMGVGSASAFLCALKIVVDYFPVKIRGLLMGATLTFGTIGALISGNILITIISKFGWKNTSYISVFIGIIIFILCFVFIKLLPSEEKIVQKYNFKWKNLFHIIKNILCQKNVVIYSIISISVYTPLAMLADLWGSSFIQAKFLISKEAASSISLNLYLGLGIGSIILPWICQKYSILKKGIAICAVVTFVLFCIIIYVPNINIYILNILMIMIGFFCGAEMMCFTVALQSSTKENSGEVIGTVNTFNMLGGALLQQGMGQCLAFMWSGQYTKDGRYLYTLEEYQYSFIPMIAILCICAIISIIPAIKDRDS